MLTRLSKIFKVPGETHSMKSLITRASFYGRTEVENKTAVHHEHDIKKLEYEIAYALGTGNKSYFTNILNLEKERVLADVAALNGANY